ncbi:MAG: DUF58 domain-containing protein [Burkholderiales bacterium]|nr:DUF58 domain-containing protein [Burkholderiales bacterium]
MPREEPARPGRTARATPRQRWRDWWLARHPHTDTWTLGQRNIYILPTRGGLVFAATLLIMLLASINYQLNLGYVLTFLLAGAGLVSIQLTHGTLRGLTLRLKPPAPVFAGEAAALEVVLSSPGGTRHGVGLHFHDRQQEQRNAWCDVPALGQAGARLAIVPARRGRHEVPALVVETRFPFGLFRAWSIWRPASEVLAWPAPERPTPPLPTARAAGSELRQARRGSGAELDGVRAWRRGDSLRQVVWKKAARTGELVSRETAAEGSRELDLDWHDAAGAGAADARLARLTAWVLEADREGLACGLRLPGVRLAPGRGDGHRRELLKALALWR